MKLEIGQKVKINNLVLECKRIIKDGSPREVYECCREGFDLLELDEDALDILGAKIVHGHDGSEPDRKETRRAVWTITTIGPDYEGDPDNVCTNVFASLDDTIRELNCIWAVDNLKQCPGLHSIFIEKGADFTEKRKVLEKDGFCEWICFGRQYIVKRHFL